LFQFRLTEADVIALMRKSLKRSSFNLWRKRVNSGVSQKHLQKRNPEIHRVQMHFAKTDLTQQNQQKIKASCTARITLIFYNLPS